MTEEKNFKPLLIAVCGPTASGKTHLAIQLAQWLKTEIVSFDSRQFFKELKIGAAPPSEEELSAAQHHFIHHLSIHQPYNAGDFERDVIPFLDQLFAKHQNVVTVGGSGMYLKALTEGFDELPSNISEIRTQLNSRFKENGLPDLLKELQIKDPDYFKIVDQNNPVRIIRALEVIEATGHPYSAQRKNTKKERAFNVVKIGIDYNREELYNRINKRVDLMIEHGLIDEAKSLFPYKENNALQTVGYKELFQYFEGNCTLEFAISEIKKNSRRYAKRQMTWFKKDAEIKWFAPNNLTKIQHFLKEQYAL